MGLLQTYHNQKSDRLILKEVVLVVNLFGDLGNDRCTDGLDAAQVSSFGAVEGRRKQQVPVVLQRGVDLGRTRKERNRESVREGAMRGESRSLHPWYEIIE